MKLKEPNYAKIQPEEYCERVRSSSQEKALFNEIIKPLVDETISNLSEEKKATMIALGIGYGYEINHSELQENPNLRLVGLDISDKMLAGETRDELTGKFCVCADNANLPIA